MSLDLTVLAALWPIVRDMLGFIWAVLPIPVTDVLLWQFLYLPVLLALRFIVAVQYKRGGLWAVLTPVALRTAILDVYLNYTTCVVLFWEWPKKGEATISKRCKRWVLSPGLRGGFARLIAKFTNRFDKNHIPLP